MFQSSKKLHQNEAKWMTEISFIESVNFSTASLQIFDYDPLPDCGLGENPETVEERERKKKKRAKSSSQRQAGNEK